MAQVADRTTLLREACTLGEDVYKRVGELEASTDSDDLSTRLAGAEEGSEGWQIGRTAHALFCMKSCIANCADSLCPRPQQACR